MFYYCNVSCYVPIGIQYIVEPVSHRCAASSAIPRGAGTVEPTSDKRIMGMKDAFNLLFGLAPKEFFYVGTVIQFFL